MKTLITHLNESVKPIFKGTIKSPYTAVDLGLSVKWCDCNVGAKSPEELGLLFQFSIPKGYKYDDENHNLLSEEEYNDLCINYNDGDILKLEDDTAHINMKGDWRMPTSEEINELCGLSKKWTELNGVKGYEFTGKNGNTLFFPAAGFFSANNNSFNGKNSEGGIWSSTFASSINNYAYGIYFNNNNFLPNNYYRFCGFSVRGVCK